MAWDKELIAEGVPAPDLNDEIRANWAALEDALNKETYFSTGGEASLQGILKQGGARCFFQATAPATRVDGSAFAATDLGLLWVDSNSSPVNQLNILTAITPTWTPVSVEIIAALLAAVRTFAEVITFEKAPVIDLPPSFTAGVCGPSSHLVGQNEADDATVNLIRAGRNEADDTDVAQVPDLARLASNAAPTEDTQIPNKKYVDDQVQSSQAAGTSNISLETDTFTDMTNMSIDLTTKGGNVLLMFSASFEAGEDKAGLGVRFRKTTAAAANYHEVKLGTAPYRRLKDAETPVSIQYLVTGLSAGTYNFVVQWRTYTSDGDNKMEQNGASFPRIFTVVELPQ